MASPARSHYTPEEYLAIEREAEYKSEYVNGQIYAMSGASRKHNLVTGNVFREISSQFRGKPCEAYIGDMRVKVSPTGMYTYPDVVAVCGEPRFEDTGLDTLLNPTVIIEALSESTEAHDRGLKFAHYRKIESLVDYVLVAQDKMRVEHYTRQGDGWLLHDFSDPGDTLSLPSIGCELALRDVYDKVAFPDEGV